MTDRSLVATTRNAELQPLGTGGQPAVQAWDQIAGHLRRALGPAHAALLAEPNPDVDRGVTDWYAEGDGPAVPLGRLPEAERETARARLAELVGAVRGEADLLRRSAREGDRFLGELLSLALEIPSEDSVRVVAGQPVLVAWGHAPVAGPAAPELLIGMTRRAGVAAPGGGGTAAPADTAVPMRILGPPPPPPPAAPVRRGWLGPGLALASLLLIPLALLLLWLDPWRWLQPPALVCVVAGDDLALLEEQRREEAREGALRAEIARLTRELGDRRIACAPPPATEPPPRRAEAAPETTPTPDPPRVEPPNRDIERAREQGGRTGQVQIVLAWEDENDLDLEVICPNGQRIRYDRRRACGGELDIDRNAAPPLTRRAVENIVFDGPPAPGRYRIVVTNFANNPPARPVSPFRVTVRIEGQPDRVYTGQLAPRGVSEVGAFEIPPR